MKSGPPELPLLIEASVCIKLSYGPKLISLLNADIIPVVTVPPRPKGFPMAITEWPTFAVSESAKLTNGRGFFDSTFRSAISVSLSVPINFASSSVSS